MARVMIFRPDGTESPYFWKDHKGGRSPLKVVYKVTSDGVKRKTGVRYDLANKTFKKIDESVA